MPIKTYTKKRTLVGEPSRFSRLLKRRSRAPKSKFQRFMPPVLLTIGSILLANAIWPILSYELFTSPSLKAADTSVQSQAQVIVREYLLPTPKPTPKVIAQELDYTDLSNWFPETAVPILTTTQAKRYTLSIPAVNIKDAEVMIGGTNLDRSLIQYPGTANPGDYGAPVIFGHSVLRQFYDPRLENPRRYVSIFSTIMTLKKGDLITMTSDGVTYTYKVNGKTEVKPEDTFILEQHHDVRELKLVTCVPEGTYLRRGVITAQLVEVQ